MLTVGWFSSGRGPGSRRLLATVHDEIAAGRLDASIPFVFCNREPGQDPQTDLFLEQARGHGLPLVCLSSLRFRRELGEKPARPGEPLPEWRRDFDREVIRLLEPYPFDIGMLAGYMLIATELLCERYDLLNLHPAAPDGPAGTWQEVIWRLIEQRADHSGVRIHPATTELDTAWARVVDEVTKKKPMLGAVLTQARPVGVSDRELAIVLTGNHFHREMLADTANRELVVQAVRRWVPGADRMRVQAAGEAAGGLAEHPAVQAAIAEFQGEVVAVRPRLPEGEGQ